MAVEELNREDLQKIWDEEAAGEGTPPVIEPSPEAPAQASGEQETEPPEKEPEPTPDPLDEIRAKLGVLDRLEQRIRNTEGHIGGLTSELRTFQKELKTAAVAAVDTQGAAPSQQQIAAAAKSLEKWNSLKGDFPEWADAIEERIGALPTPQAQQPIDVDALRKTIVAEVAASYEPRLVDVAHRGWRQLVRTEGFKDWLNAQPDEVRSLAGSPKADDAIELLDRYKETNKVIPKTADEIEAERRARLKSAAESPRGQGSLPHRKGIDDMTDEEYWNYLARTGGKK